METIAYGLFRDRASADAAIEALGRHGFPKDVLGVQEHTGQIEDQEVRGVGTRSRSYAVIGAMVAAVVGGVLGAMFFGDAARGGPLVSGLIAAIGAAVLGGLLAMLAGAAIPRPEIEALNREVAAGKVLVTVAVESKETSREVRSKLSDLGAVRSGQLSGAGLKSTLRAWGARTGTGTPSISAPKGTRA